MRHVSAMAVARRERFVTDQATYQCMPGHAPWPWPGAPRTRAPPDVWRAPSGGPPTATRHTASPKCELPARPARSAVREAERQPQPSGAAAARGAAAGTRGRRAEPATPGMVMPTSRWIVAGHTPHGRRTPGPAAAMRRPRSALSRAARAGWSLDHPLEDLVIKDDGSRGSTSRCPVRRST